MAFRGGRAMLQLGIDRLSLNNVSVDEYYPRLLAHYGERIDVFTTLYPGVEKAIEALRSEGYRTGICTNKPEALAESLMRKLGVRSLFDSLIGADTLPVRKPDPAPYRAAVDLSGGAVTQSLLVGDTITDRDTARAAGVPCVLVAFEPGGGEVANLAPGCFSLRAMMRWLRL